MNHYTKIALILSICLTICFIADTVAQVSTDTPIADYIFETIEVPGVDFLEVTASNDFGIMLATREALMVKKQSVLRSLTGSLQRMISPARRTLISMRSVIMGMPPDTTKIARGCTMVSF